ncbi:ExeA family protein [Helicovermis profundi]|uniref:AAA family ATPase n=1 Tax=Helicovermis profundi TaxID=3065157 RepID=A0AAU9E954_9FIRM|nr:AAA family ATPase [Clostridia bacterium S502]BEP29267.1 AAA family ATPase [Clostridia bacterium S502]BEP29272.1 AAA family ATPase [Clostridia bacterium S502]BEP29433.1 AAA family ATPase [Clostridia bacterium S502]BEP30321.1 AAA family ATPase [Clostridia bacterium S502]
MDYTSRFGLDFNPFIKNSKEIIIETSEYKETLLRLNILLETRGFGLITGSPGKGKTTIIRSWSKILNPSLFKVIYSSLSTLTVAEFYKNLAQQLGLEPMMRKNDNFKIIQNEITRYAVEKRITPVIIIDEANYINNGILNDLKILFNFEMDSKDRAVVLLVGLPNINNTLRLVSHEPLRQRITMNYHLDGLNKEEARSYIKNKLIGANCHVNIFSEGALEGIINSSNGIPRIINKICNACLLIGNNQNITDINNDIVMMAVNETELG